MCLDELRYDLIVSQKKGLPFICASVVIWFLIAIVSSLNIAIETKNILFFVCSMPMLPIAWIIGEKLNVNIFSEENPLGKLGLYFTSNQLIYLLIVIWAFNAQPEKMLMLYAMVFGAHLLPYSWLYKSKSYLFFSIFIPIISLILGSLFAQNIIAITLFFIEIIFVVLLNKEIKYMIQNHHA